MIKQKGFGITLAIVAVAVLIVAGVVGWSIYSGKKAQTDTKATSNGQAAITQTGVSSSQSSPDTSSKAAQFELASGHVAFTLQDGWLASGSHKSTDCARTLESVITCIDQSSVFPVAAGRVEGVPAYTAEVAVYRHEDRTSAKEWWENDFKGDNGTTSVSGHILNASTAPISGYDTYTFTLDRDNDSGEVNYIVASKDYIVLVKAIAAGKTPSTGVSVQTFPPAIKKMIDTIKIQ